MTQVSLVSPITQKTRLQNTLIIPEKLALRDGLMKIVDRHGRNVGVQGVGANSPTNILPKNSTFLAAE